MLIAHVIIQPIPLQASRSSTQPWGYHPYGSAVPTPDMYLYAVRASVGDDVYHEPCTKALEAHMAKITGKEAALFVPSGTMSNQLALRTHLKQPPYAVLCDHRAHIVRYVDLTGVTSRCI